MSDEAWNALTELSITCGMNVRYWAIVESAASGWIVFALVSAFLVAGVFAATVAAFTERWQWGLLSVALAVPLAIAPFSEIPFIPPRALPSPHLSKQWGDLKREIDLTIVDEDESQLQTFRRKIVELNSTEPQSPSESLLLRCLAAEEKSRGVK